MTCPDPLALILLALVVLTVCGFCGSAPDPANEEHRPR